MGQRLDSRVIFESRGPRDAHPGRAVPPIANSSQSPSAGHIARSLTRAGGKL
jgi:hypothetical protein